MYSHSSICIQKKERQTTHTTFTVVEEDLVAWVALEVWVEEEVLHDPHPIQEGEVASPVLEALAGTLAVAVDPNWVSFVLDEVLVALGDTETQVVEVA